MLDLPRLTRLNLTTIPRMQQLGAALVGLNYALASVRIEVEGIEHIPRDSPVIFAMNHTDRFNYMPFQYDLLRRGGFRYIATWVKGKYYDNAFVGWLLEATDNIPVPSRGYVYTKDFQRTLGRLPTEAEYELVRHWRDDPENADEPPAGHPDLAMLWRTPRDILGLSYSPQETTYPRFMDRLFDAMMHRFVEVNRQALLEKSLNVQVFPQGTRSIRLSRGHIGIAQLAMHLNVPIVPVGCNGSNLLYPGNVPWAKHGTVIYRIGSPMTWDDALKPFRIDEPFIPFTRAAEMHHRDRFQVAVDQVMDRINTLLEPPYQYAADRESDGVQGAHRFV